MLHGKRDLGDVVFNEEFGTSISSVIQARCGNAAQVADETRTEEIDESQNIIVFTSLDNVLEPRV